MNARSLAKLNYRATVRSFEKRGSLYENRLRTFKLEQAQKVVAAVVAQHPDGVTPEERQAIKRTVLESVAFNEFGFPDHDPQDTEQLRTRSNVDVHKTRTDKSGFLQTLRLERLLGVGFDRFLAAAKRILAAWGASRLGDTPTTPPPLEQRPQVQATAPTF
jgi:tellurite resistance protein